MATIKRREGKRGVTYQVSVRVSGSKPEYGTFSRLTDARKWASEKEAELRRRRRFPQDHGKKTVAQMIERYTRDVLPHKEQDPRHSQKFHLTWWSEHYGHVHMQDFTASVLAEGRDCLLREPGRYNKKRSPSTVNRYLATISHVLSIAFNEWEWLRENPVRKSLKRKEPSGRVRYLDKDERKALLSACEASRNSDLLDIVQVALGTGMRQGEILSLEWSNIDFDLCAVILRPDQTKNKSSRTIPLHGASLAALQRRSRIRRIDTPLVFPLFAVGESSAKNKDIRDAWERAVKDSGVSDLHFHDLRHTFASYLAMSGASLIEIAELLGHKTLAMVKRYAHLSQQHNKTVVERMHRYVSAAEEAAL